MPYRNTVISSGHGKYIRGAAGPAPWGLDEVDEARRVVNRVADLLRARAVNVKTFHDDTSRDQNTNLKTIVNYHNSQVRELDISVHFNAYQTTSKPMGTECLYVTQSALSAKVATAIAGCGFTNRGAKYRSDLYFLNNTAMPSILIEVVFVDSSADAGLYKSNFEQVCGAIADVIGGASDIQPIPPPDPGPDPEQPNKSRPLIGKGDYGNNVRELQAALSLDTDGDFGNMTHNAVQQYQATKGLSVDGLVGSQTWAALAKDFPALPLYPPPLPALLTQDAIAEIVEIAANSSIASYSWRDRGRAPAGYTNGMAVAYAQAVARFRSGDPLAMEMAKANTRDDAIDALSWYNSNFVTLGMNNDRQDIATLRHLYVLLMGLGMRESSGRYCTGRDQSATNTTADTCEAGLFQTSWNARACCTDFLNLADTYDPSSPQGYQSVFSRAVTCSPADWASYGSGDGYQFQETCKWSPTYAVETAAIGLRNIRQHWGPINRKEAELRSDADALFKEIEAATAGAVA